MERTLYWPVLLLTGLVMLLVAYLLGIEALDLISGAQTEHSPLGVVITFGWIGLPLLVASVVLVRRRRQEQS